MTAQAIGGTPAVLPPVPLHGVYTVVWLRPGRDEQGQCTTNAWGAVEQMRRLVLTEAGTSARVWHNDTGVVLYDSATGLDRAAHCRRCTTPWCSDGSVHQPEASRRYPWALRDAWDQAPEEYTLTLPTADDAAHLAAQVTAAGGAVLRLGAVLCMGHAALAVLAALPATTAYRVELDAGATIVWVRDKYLAETFCPVLLALPKAG